MIDSLKMEFQAGHSKNESGILTLAYNRQDIDTTGLIIHFIKVTGSFKPSGLFPPALQK
ncbi:hypothetical protein ISL52_003324 [Salmonella enterica]|nr:hypothetical protein [Salmonella enterica]